VSLAHWTHTSRAEQTGVAVPAQSTLAVHCTHSDVFVSQCAVSPEHWASVVHPARHVNVTALQTGAAFPQFEFDRHATHAPVAVRQMGSATGQSLFAAHSTHCCVIGSQIFAVVGQSAAVLQPTHAPADVQMGASRLHCVLLVHAARHEWEPG